MKVNLTNATEFLSVASTVAVGVAEITPDEGRIKCL